ncbi:hypothetical protein NX722_22135 [Endozoicomonas gorgoniicola]|uniref:Uncharacterized protein n=1 Tax=Endozoicomonas gorgoniicola TaxID=1234144 RepID=A0ABT3N0X1_9GAMM|nr:hypothetical protein [Endozoicomonas gorgoniicola]MCW7555276.1 hypothetical protein [Endozoicomonas gorgoniicola]
MVLSAFLKLAAIASLGYWWMWLFLGTAYYYLIQHDSLWSSVQSGAGMMLVVFVIGMLSVQLSEMLVPMEEYSD